MTTLNCSAVSCVYNKERLCSKGDILVTGENAHSANETSCGSFLERSESAAQNSTVSGCGCREIEIDCKAHDCTYNEHCNCTAASIQVEGGSAQTPRETCCGTFRRQI